MAVFQTREQALHEITALAERHSLTLEDIANAITVGESEKSSRNIGNVIVSILSYIGGLLVFAGLGVYANMEWKDLTSLQRVLITLGPGLVTLLLTAACLKDERYLKASTPFLLISVVLQPTGMLTFLKEYFPPSQHPELAISLVFLVLCVQQAALFSKYRQTLMLLTTILSGFTGFGEFLYWLRADMALCDTVLAFAGFCLTQKIARIQQHQALAPWLYALFGLAMIGGLYALLMPFSIQWSYVVIGGILAATVVLQSVKDFTIARPAAMFFVICFYQSFIASALDSLRLHDGWGLLLAGGSGFAIAYGLRDTIQKKATPALYFVFAAMMSSGVFDLLQNTPLDPLMIGFGALMMYISVLLTSRMLLAVSVASLLGYLTYYTNHYFAHVVGWPLALVVLGMTLILISAYAVKLGRKITKTP